MTPTLGQITKLKKVIAFAEKKGHVPKIQYKANPMLYKSTILFDHDFAQKVFGGENVEQLDCGHIVEREGGYGHKCKDFDDGVFFSSSGIAWKLHIQQAVISKDVINYYYKYIKAR